MKLMLFLVCVFARESLGRILRFGYIENPNAVIVEHDEMNNQTTVSGHIVELAQWLADYNHFSFEFVPLEYAQGFSGLGKELSEKNLDVALPLFGMSAGRNRIVTFLMPSDYYKDVIILPYPKRDSDPWSCVKPFTTGVWICVIVCVISMPIVLKLAAAFKIRKQRKISSFLSMRTTSLYVLGVITNQGGYFSSKTRSVRLVAAIWCLAAVVLVNAYSSLLITYMTAPKISLIVHDVEELVKRDDIQILALKDAFTRIKLETATGFLRPLADNVARKPADFCGTLRDSFTSPKVKNCLKKIKDGGYVFAAQYNEGVEVMDADYRRNKVCSFTLLEIPYYTNYFAMVVPLKITHEMRNTLDVSTLEAISYGLTRKWTNLYSPPSLNSCANYKKQSKKIKKLTLTDFAFAFMLLAVGYLLASLVFFYERISKRLSSTRHQLDLTTQQ